MTLKHQKRHRSDFAGAETRASSSPAWECSQELLPTPCAAGCTSLWEEKPGQNELGLSDLGSSLSQILHGFLDDSGRYHENCVL